MDRYTWLFKNKEKLILVIWSRLHVEQQEKEMLYANLIEPLQKMSIIHDSISIYIKK